MDGLTKKEFLERWLGVVVNAQGYTAAARFVYDLNRIADDGKAKEEE